MEKTKKNLVLIDTGASIAEPETSAQPRLYTCLTIADNGEVHRVSNYPDEAGHLLGIHDLPLTVPNLDATRAAEDIASEALRVDAGGVFADFERAGNTAFTLVRALADALSQMNIPLYVPLSCAEADERTIITAETAVSGGSLSDFLTKLIETYGKHRIAAFVRPVSSVFDMPTDSTEGKPLLAAEREALQGAYDATPYFSRELCAKYFTYTDELGQPHFVLFDDAATMNEKLALLAGKNVHTTFLTDTDAAVLLPAP